MRHLLYTCHMSHIIYQQDPTRQDELMRNMSPSCAIACVLHRLAQLAPDFSVASNIRETLVKMFTGSIPVRHVDAGDYSSTEQHSDTIVPAQSHVPSDPSICIFWCAVALGSLVQGRPIKSVRSGGHFILSPGECHGGQSHSGPMQRHR